MGRPRKNPVQQLEVQENVTNPVIEDLTGSVTSFTAPVQVELNNLALSIVRNPVTQHWMLVQFNFDFTTETFGKLVVVEEHTDRIEIVERFKMIAGAKLMSPV